MSPRADLAVYDGKGRLAAAVEVKNKLGTSSEWATVLRRNLLSHSGFGHADFMLLVTPDRIYLWKENEVSPQLAPPSFELAAQPILRPYFELARIDPHAASGQAFELVVADWLSDLARSRTVLPNQAPLLESGFVQAIQNGRIEFEAAA